MSPDLEKAFRYLYDVVWNQTATVDISVSGYNGISYADTDKINEACKVVEQLLLEEDTR
jgi:hypothetical protein